MDQVTWWMISPVNGYAANEKRIPVSMSCSGTQNATQERASVQATSGTVVG